MKGATIGTRSKLRPAASPHRNERSFARAKPVARAIVAEQHDRPSLV
jgi:hypothetical protein